MNSLKLGKFTKKYVVAGFGNPIFDISAPYRGTDILEKFNLQADGQKEVTSFEFSAILNSLKSENCEVKYSPGGCVQNTLRIVQALVKHPSFCIYFGGLGDDTDGDLLESAVRKSGVETRYAKHSSYPTGKVISLINEENRSLVANLGAAEVYRLEDLNTRENLKALQEVSIVYIEAFFITHSFDVGCEVVNLCRTYKSALVFNLSGVYVADIWPKELLAMAKAADIVIGNAVEFNALSKLLDLQTCSTVEDLTVKLHSALWAETSLANFKLNQMNHFGKTVIVTQGRDSVLCVCADKNLIKHVTPKLDAKLIKDTTGAGDAFVAGFLVAFLDERSAADCLAYGCSIAQQVIQHVGVHLSNEEAQ